MSEPPAPAVPVLGESAGVVTFERREELAGIVLAMARQCRRNLDIVSRHLDPGLYDEETFVEAVKELCLGSRYARVRLLIMDSRPLLGQGHRRVELAMKLTSYIEIRAPAPQHRTFNEAWLLADNAGYVQRQFADRYEGNADFADRRLTAALRERFDDLWERGQSDANFRRLHI